MARRRREPVHTSPPTLSAGEVARVFGHQGITTSTLQNLDKWAFLRPSYYLANSGGLLLSPPQRDARITSARPTRGDPRRRYTYSDLVWIRLFAHIRDGLRKAAVAHAARTAGRIIADLRRRAAGRCPPSWRVIFSGTDIYLVEDPATGTAECLTRNGQLGFVQLLTDAVIAEVRGRVEALSANARIEAIPTDCDASRGDQIRAQA